MDHQVPEEVKTERLRRLQDLLNGQHQLFNEASVGQTLTVLLDRNGS